MITITNKEYARLQTIEQQRDAIDAAGCDNSEAWGEIEWPEDVIPELEVLGTNPQEMLQRAWRLILQVDISIVSIDWFNKMTKFGVDYRTIDSLSPSEAVYCFAGWLSSRKEITKMGYSESVPPIPELVNKFIKGQKLSEPRENWHLNASLMEGE